MLTAEHVRTREKAGALELVRLNDKAIARLLPVSEQLVALTEAALGESREAWEEALETVEVAAADRKVVEGLIKLLADRCQFSMVEGVDPPALRAEVFAQASVARRASTDEAPFDRAAVLTSTAAIFGLTPELLEAGLFADLKAAQRLTAFETLSAQALLVRYEQAQAQAVLLKAVKVEAVVQADATTLRFLFRSLKFRRLLYQLEKLDTDAYRLILDGPHSLFSSVTKYGLQLALVLPAIEACPRWGLKADLRWGKEKKALTFELSGQARDSGEGEAPLPEEVEALKDRFASLETGFRVQRARAILELKGVGLCVPDLVFTDEASGQRVYLEVMGYWSRDAVWKRVELVRAGLAERVIFAVSSRLRVSEAALDEALPSELYVYKGSMSARAIADRLQRFCQVSPA